MTDNMERRQAMPEAGKAAFFALFCAVICTGFFYWLFEIEWEWNLFWWIYPTIFVGVCAMGFNRWMSDAARDNLAEPKRTQD